jgi:hypothetical protein
MSTPAWNVTSADEGSEELAALMSENLYPWEPFAVTTRAGWQHETERAYNVVWLRRRG